MGERGVGARPWWPDSGLRPIQGIRDVACANRKAIPGFEFMHTLALFARWPSALSKSNELSQTLLLYVGPHAAPSPEKAYSIHHGLQSGSTSSRLAL